MMQCHEEEFFKSVIERDEYYGKIDLPVGVLAAYMTGFRQGMKTVVRLFAAQTGKLMKDNESINEYYERWLSMEYAQTDIPDKMAELEDIK